MNLIFGGCGSKRNSAWFTQASQRLERQYGGEVRRVATNSPGGVLGYLSDDGAVLGIAEDDGAALVFVGAMINRLPDWQGDAPIDDPHRTARYLLDRWRRLGPTFLDGLIGSYALAICDSADGRLILASDPFGQRDLYLYQTDADVTFCSKSGAMRMVLGDELQLNRAYEDFLLGYEFVPGGGTPYKNVKRLSPGTMLDCRGGQRETSTIQKPRDLDAYFADVDFDQATEDQVVDLLHDVFMRAVDEMSPTTERVGVLLGGFDSALVASALAKSGKRVSTFSFHFPDQRFNQPLTDTVAEQLGIEHHHVPITPEVIRDGLAHFADRFNQPVGQPHYLIESAHLCQQIRQHDLLHCFSGDGCDGIFLGYPTVYRRVRLIDRLTKMPRVGFWLAEKMARSRFLERRLGHPYRVGRNVLSILQREMPARGHLAARTLDDFALANLRVGPPPPQEKPVEQILQELAEGLEDLSTVRLAYHAKSVVGLNRNKLLGCADHAGIVIHSPYLHPELGTLARRLPDRLSRPDDNTKTAVTGKHVLMKMAETKGLLAPEIIYQAKRSPVQAPVDSWYAGPLRSFMIETVRDLPFDYDERYIEALLRPKLSEDLYRKYVDLGNLASHGIALLATYASFARQTVGGNRDGA